ncbi:Anaerobic benzoate catabolism transcriptional regulator, partial [Dysosmobacter welbionis]
HGVVDLIHGGVDGVHGDDADHVLLRLVAVRRHIAASVGQGDLHVQRRAVVQRGNVHVGIQDLHLAVGLDIAGL